MLLRQGDGGQLTSPSPGYEPKDYFLTETYVEFNQESMTEQRFPNGSSRTWITMRPRSVRCSLMHTENTSITPARRPVCSSVVVVRVREIGATRCRNSGKKSHERSGQPIVERGQELNTEHAQIRTLLDRQRSKSSPTVRRRLRNTNSRLITNEEVYKN